jgi:peptidoglycan hydrolase CwlO-like protein
MSSEQQSQQKTTLCRGCNTEITFRPDHKTEGGKWIPLNLDLTNHDCPARKKNNRYKPSQQQQLTELTKQVSGLNETVKALISQIQSLRSEVKSKREVSNA